MTRWNLILNEKTSELRRDDKRRAAPNHFQIISFKITEACLLPVSGKKFILHSH